MYFPSFAVCLFVCLLTTKHVRLSESASPTTRPWVAFEQPDVFNLNLRFNPSGDNSSF